MNNQDNDLLEQPATKEELEKFKQELQQCNSYTDFLVRKKALKKTHSGYSVMKFEGEDCEKYYKENCHEDEFFGLDRFKAKTCPDIMRGKFVPRIYWDCIYKAFLTGPKKESQMTPLEKKKADEACRRIGDIMREKFPGYKWREREIIS